MTEDRLAVPGRRVSWRAVAGALAAATTAATLAAATVGCGADSSQPLSLRAGSVAAEPIGSATSEPAGAPALDSAGLTTPAPAAARSGPAGAVPTVTQRTSTGHTVAARTSTAQSPQPPETVTITTEPPMPVQGQPVRFRATATGGAPTSWRWRILALLAPEGTDLQTVATSGSPSFSHTFPTAGRGTHYLVQLTVANAAGSASAGHAPADGVVLDVAAAGDQQGS